MPCGAADWRSTSVFISLPCTRRPVTQVLLGVDDMDVFKGIELKLQAYERLLEEHPEWRGKVVLVQVRGGERHLFGGGETPRVGGWGRHFGGGGGTARGGGWGSTSERGGPRAVTPHRARALHILSVTAVALHQWLHSGIRRLEML
jgi:hypothetical protein